MRHLGVGQVLVEERGVVPDSDDRGSQAHMAVGVQRRHPGVGGEAEIVCQVLAFDPVVLPGEESVVVGIDVTGTARFAAR